MNFVEMIDEVRRAGGMDADVGQVSGWLNGRYKKLCVRSDWTKQIVAVGSTVVDQARYSLSDSISEVHEARVGGLPLARIGARTLWDLDAARVHQSTETGFIAPIFSTAGQAQIELFPVPTEAGLSIEVLATVEPDPLSGQDVPLVPHDFHRSIVEGAISDALALLDENLQSADYYEQRFEKAISDLKLRQNRRVRSGNRHVLIEGVHY